KVLPGIPQAAKPRHTSSRRARDGSFHPPTKERSCPSSKLNARLGCVSSKPSAHRKGCYPLPLGPRTFDVPLSHSANRVDPNPTTKEGWAPSRLTSDLVPK